VILTIAFGPSRAEGYRRAVAYGHRWGHSAVEDPQTGRSEVVFHLHEVGQPYARAAQLLELVRGWRGTEASIDGQPEQLYVVQAMLWCAARWLRSRGDCGQRYWTEVFAKCRACPLFDPDRAAREIAGS
jgi:hypothetical protein